MCAGTFAILSTRAPISPFPFYHLSTVLWHHTEKRYQALHVLHATEYGAGLGKMLDIDCGVLLVDVSFVNWITNLQIFSQKKDNRYRSKDFCCKSNAIELSTLSSPVVSFRFLLFRQATTTITIAAVTTARNVERLNTTHPTMSAVVAPGPVVAVELEPGPGVTVELEPDGRGEELKE